MTTTWAKFNPTMGASCRPEQRGTKRTKLSSCRRDRHERRVEVFNGPIRRASMASFRRQRLGLRGQHSRVWSPAARRAPPLKGHSKKTSSTFQALAAAARPRVRGEFFFVSTLAGAVGAQPQSPDEEGRLGAVRWTTRMTRARGHCGHRGATPGERSWPRRQISSLTRRASRPGALERSAVAVDVDGTHA